MFLTRAAWAALVAAVALTPLVAGHPGEEIDERAELEQSRLRHAIADVNKRALAACGNSGEIQARRQQAMERRLATFHRLREERGLKDEPFLHRRDDAQFAHYNSLSHNLTGKKNFTASTPHAELFGANTTCITTPDNADGPYYVGGELIRSNVVEDQPGVPYHLEIQFIDVHTCRPAPKLFIDVWACNATGIYSGVSAAGQGGLKTTYLRGMQETDADGVVEFDALFPGHYEGRAPHQHIIAHVGAEALPNKTFTGGHISHLSQLFFDQGLISRVEALPPYNTNKLNFTTNLEDQFTGFAASASYDPFVEYIQLGKDLSAGLFAWIEIGLNTSANWDSYAPLAATLGPDGGVDNLLFPNQSSIVGTPPPSHG